MEKYTGNDNYGNPKSEYINQLAAMDDGKLGAECENKIWLSAFASNNRRSDYHWQVDACYDECKRRDKLNIYEVAFKRASS